jgi:hypothetical protein
MTRSRSAFILDNNIEREFSLHPAGRQYDHTFGDPPHRLRYEIPRYLGIFTNSIVLCARALRMYPSFFHKQSAY